MVVVNISKQEQESLCLHPVCIYCTEENFNCSSSKQAFGELNQTFPTSPSGIVGYQMRAVKLVFELLLDSYECFLQQV